MSIFIVLWGWSKKKKKTNLRSGLYFYLFNNPIPSAMSSKAFTAFVFWVPQRFIFAVKTNLMRIFSCWSNVVVAIANGYHLCVGVKFSQIKLKRKSLVYECTKWFRIISREMIVSVVSRKWWSDGIKNFFRYGIICVKFDCWIKYFQWIFISVFICSRHFSKVFFELYSLRLSASQP